MMSARPVTPSWGPSKSSLSSTWMPTPEKEMPGWYVRFQPA